MDYKTKKHIDWENVKREVRNNAYKPRKTNYTTEVIMLIVSLVLAVGAVWYFHLEVIMPHLNTLVPEAKAMTNEEACELLKSGYFIHADNRAVEYCL